LSRESTIKEGENVRDGDSRYLAPEMINDVEDCGVAELSKADIFSLGATIFELMVGEDLPKNEERWHYLRGGL
jgi:wee1-like protein kinase